MSQIRSYSKTNCIFDNQKKKKDGDSDKRNCYSRVDKCENFASTKILLLFWLKFCVEKIVNFAISGSRKCETDKVVS